MRPSRKTRNRQANRIHRVAQAIQPERLEHRWLFAGISANNEAGFTTFNAVGNTNVATTITNFLAHIGGAPNGADPNQHPDGSRKINWDGVKLDGTDFGGQTQTIIPNKVVGIPINRFQTNGALFGEVYPVAGDGFASVNPGVAGQINAFSPKNTFAHFNDVGIEQNFIRPSLATSNPIHEATRGFGAVFLDVERAHSSYIEYFHGDDSLGKFFVNPGPSGAAEFVGVLFNAPIVTRVEVSPGDSPLFFFNHGHVASGQADLSKGGTEDQAAVDDFLYAEPATTVNPFLIHPTEGQTFSGQVGRFTTTNANPHASDFSATINWGDGTSSNGSIALGTGGAFKVNGTHKYAEEGTFNVSIAIHDTTGHTSTGRAIAAVADAPLTSKGLSFNASNERAFIGTVATLADGDTSETNAAEFNAVINWGDGTSTVGQLLSLGSGKFAVRGDHQYLNTGNFTVKITIDDIGGSTTTATSTAHVI